MSDCPREFRGCVLMIDPIQQALLNSWKQAGGIYREAAETVEADLEREEFDAIRRSTSPSPTEAVR